MTGEVTPFAFLLVIPGLVTLALAIYIWRRGRRSMASPLLFLSISSALWALAHVGEIMGADLSTKLFWAKAQYFGSVFVPVAWLTVGLQYTNRRKRLTVWKVIGLSVVPICVLVLTWTNDWHGLIWSETYVKEAGPFSVLGVTYGPAFWAWLAYSYVLLVVGTGCLLAMVVRSPRFYLGQRLVLIFSVMLPWIANVAYLQGWGPAFDLTSFAFPLSAVVIIYGILRFDLIDIVPIARDLVLENLTDALFVLDMDNRVVDINPTGRRIVDRPARAVLGLPIREVLECQPELSPDVLQQEHAHTELELGTGPRRRLLAADISLLRDSEGEPVGRLMICRDVTDREETQDKLRRAERQYRDLFEEAPMMYVVTRSEGGRSVIEDCNNSFLTSLGYTRKEVVGRELGEFARASSPDPDEPWGQGPPQDRVRDQEQQLLRKDGGVLQTLIRTVALRAADGQTRGERAMYIDISQRRKAEQEIYRLQAQLYQSQKVEAIGRLAGGVAHDFNNVLTAVLGYTTMLLEQIDEGKPMYADLKQIEAAAERAASLTHKLITFTHQQVLTLVIIDLNRVVREIGRMLQRLIGEDVIMTTQLASEPCGIKADPTLLEQILVNLAVNARDAMPSGGSLTIGTETVTFATAHAEAGETVPPGRYVRLSVSDTGCGMTPDTKVRVFEPFFTTKRDKGTGLGLATVDGTIRQLGGFIFVRSELRQGTTFEIYLPHCDGLVSQTPTKTRTGIEIGVDEMVLLVEDDAMVRKFSALVLARHGYRVLEADSADRALTLLDECEDPLHLLLTDVTMPGMSGSVLAAIVETRRPGAKILFMSGYTGDMTEDIMRRGGELLEKPFSAATLLQRVRRVLHGDAVRDADSTA